MGQTVFFNGTTSAAGTGHSIVRWDWDFGDGSRRSGSNVTRAYTTAGTYSVVLTVTDEVGQTAQRTQTVTITALANPTATFTFSPTDPDPGEQVNFNASGSTPSGRATITRYDWDFGDGDTSTGNTGPTTNHQFVNAKSYIVTLKITDSAGKTALTTQTVVVE